MTDAIVTAVRRLLSQIVDDPAVATLGDDTALFRGGLGLDSLTGSELLAAIDAELGVDIAAQDLSLASLQTIGTLCSFVARAGSPVTG